MVTVRKNFNQDTLIEKSGNFSSCHMSYQFLFFPPMDRNRVRVSLIPFSLDFLQKTSKQTKINTHTEVKSRKRRNERN